MHALLRGDLRRGVLLGASLVSAALLTVVLALRVAVPPGRGHRTPAWQPVAAAATTPPQQPPCSAAQAFPAAAAAGQALFNASNGALYRTGGVTWEGVGSYLQRIKSSIVMSLFLNKTLIILDDGIESQHHYNIGQQINGVYGLPPQPDAAAAASSCHLQRRDDAAERALMHVMCLRMAGGSESTRGGGDSRGAGGRETAGGSGGKQPSSGSGGSDGGTDTVAADEALLEAFRNEAPCKNVIHDKTYPPAPGGNGFTETYADFGDCIQPWVSQTFGRLFQQRGYAFQPSAASAGTSNGGGDCLNVGIHVRWGDVPSEDLTRLQKGNMQLVAINYAVYSLRKTGRCLAFHVFVKSPTEPLLAQFLFPHKVVDSGDDLRDMFAFSLMDVCIQGSSTYATLASIIRPGQIIITDQPWDDKYSRRYRAANRVFHFQDAEYVAAVAALQPFNCGVS